MDCPRVEDRLSEYMESSLSPESMAQVAEHLGTCPRCSALLNEMQSIVSLCHRFPTLEMDPDFVEKVLLSTSGRPRRRSLRELLKKNLAQPLFTPRFAIGAGLATLFLALMVNLTAARVPAALSSLAPSEILGLMDRGVQRFYSGGLKAYDKTNQWQARFTSFRNRTYNKMRFMIERIEVPMEGSRKPEEPERRKERAPEEKRSSLIPLSAWHERNRS